VPLSEHEQRLLEQIERQLLAEDPKFASTVRSTDPRHHARRRKVLAVVLLLAGVALLLVGVVTDITPGGVPVVGVTGFLVMFGAAVLGLQSFRRSSAPEPLRAVGRDGQPKDRPRKASFVDRLEDRWRRRRSDEGRADQDR